jgi:hypothetical protein
MAFTEWVNEYRKQLDGKSNPFFEQLGLMEAPNPLDPQNTAKPGEPTILNAPKAGNPQPAAATPPEAQKPATTPPVAPADPNADTNIKRINTIKAVFHKTLLNNSVAIDTALAKAFTTFQRGHMNAADTKNEMDAETKKAWDEAYLVAYRKHKQEKTDKSEGVREFDRKKAAREEADKAIENLTGRRENHPRARKVSGGLEIFGESAESVRLAKAVAIRVVCFELLGILLGAPSELSTISLKTELANLIAKEKEDEAKGLNDVEKANATDERKKEGKANREKIWQNNRQEQSKKDKEGNARQNDSIDKALEHPRVKVEDVEFSIEIDGIKFIINEGAIKSTVKNVAAKMFSNVNKIVSQSSMVKFAKQDTNAIGDAMVRWYLTTASFSTRLLDGHNAIAIVDGLTQGYLSHMNTHAKTFIKNMFYGKIPPAFEAPGNPTQPKEVDGVPVPVANAKPSMTFQEFEKHINDNAKKFQVNQSTNAINRIMKECLEAFMAAGRL